MTSNKSEWIKLMRPLVDGHATEKMVSAFDQLTSLMFSVGDIDFDEFISTQLVISEARKIAAHFSSIGKSGHFLPASEAA